MSFQLVSGIVCVHEILQTLLNVAIVWTRDVDAAAVSWWRSYRGPSPSPSPSPSSPFSREYFLYKLYILLILLSGEITNKKCNCGKANEGPVPLIAGGEKAGLDEFPWIVLVTLDALSLTPFLGFFCTGALLDPTHVLTAAHCVWHYSAHQLMVILASNNKRNIHPQHVAVNVTKKDQNCKRSIEQWANSGFFVQWVYLFSQNSHPLCTHCAMLQCWCMSK